MKKSSLFIFTLLTSTCLFAETVQLQDGTYVSGSITSQTEYTLNVRTSYGPVIINQRDVQAILPDKHRIHLKGGSELVGVILDLDEFNLQLQTDDGIVHIDMPQIVSVEVYDYEQGAAAQEAVAKRQAAAAAVATPAAQTSPEISSAAVAATAGAGGLTFDADIEKAFDTKKPEIINGQVQTVREISAADIRAQRAAAQLTDEQAFLKGAPTAENIAQTAEAARSGKLEKMKRAQAKKAKRPKEASFTKFFDIQIGAQTNKLKFDNSARPGFAGQAPYDVGGTSVRVESSFLWRVRGSNLWLGPSLALANIPRSSFPDLDPSVISGNAKSMAERGYLAYDPDVTTSGQLIDLQIKAAYYFTPDRLIHIYAAATGGYRFLTLNYHGGIDGESMHADTPIGALGLGAHLYADDVLIGLEVMEYVSPYGKQFSTSGTFNTVASLTFSWKF